MSHALLARLEESRQEIAAKSQAILDAADADKRDLTADEDKRFTEATAEMVEVRRRIDTVRENMTASAAQSDALERGLGAGGGNHDENRDDVEARLRKVIKGEMRRADFLAAPGEFRRAQEARALAKSANSVGVTFVGQLQQHLIDSASVLSVATVWETASGETIDVPVTTSHGAATGPISEGGTIAGTDPTITKRSLGAYKYGQLVKLSRELVDDASFDIVGYVAEAVGRNVGIALGAHLVTGSGSSQPTGVITSASAGVTGGTSVGGAFTADNLIDLFYSVIAPYRRSPKCAWLMRDASLATARKLKDGDGRYLFDITGGLASNSLSNSGAANDGYILGKPVFADPNVAAVATSAVSVAFGDFSKFVVRLAGGVRFERSDEFAFNTDEIAYRGIIRGDSILTDQTGAVKKFTGGAS